MGPAGRKQHVHDVMKGRNLDMGELIVDYLGGHSPVTRALESGRDKQRSRLESYGVQRISPPTYGSEERGRGL